MEKQISNTIIVNGNNKKSNGDDNIPGEIPFAEPVFQKEETSQLFASMKSEIFNDEKNYEENHSEKNHNDEKEEIAITPRNTRVITAVVFGILFTGTIILLLCMYFMK